MVLLLRDEQGPSSSKDKLWYHASRCRHDRLLHQRCGYGDRYTFFSGSYLCTLSQDADMYCYTGYIVYCLGSGYSMVLRSLLAAIVEPHHRGTMFNTVGILESIGAVVAGPLLAASFRLGLELNGVWVGLPFLAAAGLFSIAITILLTVRLPVT